MKKGKDVIRSEAVMDLDDDSFDVSDTEVTGMQGAAMFDRNS